VIPRERINGVIDRRKRLIAIAFCTMAVLAMTLAWSGISLRDVLAALRF